LQKVATIFQCNNCDYNTSRKSSFEKHLTTDKHKKQQNDSKMVENDSALGEKVAQYVCNCGKMYKYDSGYYRHKKICQQVKNADIDTSDKDQLILMLVKQNSELIKETSDFKNMMVDQQNMIMKVLENCTTYNTTISQNKATIE
jgi:hypothetical protein